MNAMALAAGNPGPMTGAGNNTYLLPGMLPTLIDAGAGDPGHLQEVDRALAGKPLALVLVTHGHPDHASGSEALARRWRACAFAKMPWPERDGRYAVHWTSIADGDMIPAGDVALSAVHTPGHAPDHVSFWEARTRTLFSGDLVVKDGTVIIPASHGGNLADYLASLRRVLALEPARLLPAHGPPIDDPAALLEKYLAHRQQREDQVLEAIHKGRRAVDAMVGEIYDGLAGNLVPAARESVMAHLVKLESEGRVVRVGEEWEEV